LEQLEKSGKTVETVEAARLATPTQLKQGVNEREELMLGLRQVATDGIHKQN